MYYTYYVLIIPTTLVCFPFSTAIPTSLFTAPELRIETRLQSQNKKLSRHCTSRSKMESIHTKSRMKDQGSHELVEELKKRNKKGKIDNLRFYKSLVHVYSAVIMNDLGLDRKVFCQSSRLQSFKTYNFTCSELFHIL